VKNSDFIIIVPKMLHNR